MAERFCRQTAVPYASVASHRRQPGALEHPEVFRDRGQRHRERLCQLADRVVTRRQSSQDGATRGVGKRGKGLIEQAWLVNHMV
jgi:hypothetical protein